MDYIKRALEKADVAVAVPATPSLKPHLTISSVTKPSANAKVEPQWTPPEVNLDVERLRRRRIVSFEATDPGHTSFNVLRTRVRAAMAENGWKKLGVTSPTAGCGKTTVALNLAFSLARGLDLGVVLVDLDLRKPSVAKKLGISAGATIGGFLQGRGDVSDCFVQVAPGLTIGTGGGSIAASSELLQGQRLADLLQFIDMSLSPDIVLFDLPPMGAGDDTLAFLPRIETILLVAAAGQTTIGEIDQCEQQLTERSKFLGVVLNKAESKGKDYY